MKSKTSKKKAARRIIHEDFGNELRDYLDKWSARQHGGDNEGWKFNKVVQTWALDHCFDKKKIDSKLFKSLLPYVLTVKGAALNRLSVLLRYDNFINSIKFRSHTELITLL
jgi:hypothetical protein